MEKTHWFVVVSLVALILFKGYDGFRHLWEKNKTNVMSIIWHCIGFALLSAVAIFIYVTMFGFTLKEWKAIMWLCVISYWLADMIYNKIIGQQMFYAGDGKGSVTETVFAWIGRKTGMNIISVALSVKLLLLVIAALLTTYL